MATNGIMKGIGLAGLAIAAWYLLDPKEGARRRRQIADTAKDLYDGAGQEFGRLGGSLGRIGNDVMSTVTDAVGRVTEMAGIGSSSEVADAISGSASHNGGARSTRSRTGRSGDSGSSTSTM